MIIFILLILAAAVGTFIAVTLNKRDDDGVFGQAISFAIAVTLCISLLVSTGFIIVEHVGYDIKLAGLQAKRDALVYQVESGVYFGDAVGEFNSELIKDQMMHENPWTSWYVGDYVMGVDPIELN